MLGAVEVVDYHTAGEPFRIVVGGAPQLEGSTVLAKRSYAAEHADQTRRLVTNEPRGHAGMYGGFVVPATRTAPQPPTFIWGRR